MTEGKRRGISAKGAGACRSARRRKRRPARAPAPNPPSRASPQEVPRPLPPEWHVVGPQGVSLPDGCGWPPAVGDPAISAFLDAAEGESSGRVDSWVLLVNPKSAAGTAGVPGTVARRRRLLLAAAAGGVATPAPRRPPTLAAPPALPPSRRRGRGVRVRGHCGGPDGSAAAGGFRRDGAAARHPVPLEPQGGQSGGRGAGRGPWCCCGAGERQLLEGQPGTSQYGSEARGGAALQRTLVTLQLTRKPRARHRCASPSRAATCRTPCDAGRSRATACCRAAWRRPRSGAGSCWWPGPRSSPCCATRRSNSSSATAG